MSGLHGFHVSNDAGCQDCHQATTNDGVSIAMPVLHINTQRDLVFSAAGLAYDQGDQTCTGSCHAHDHTASSWLGSGGGFHPTGFADPNVHSPEMELQRMDCRACHGADLTGGSGPSCDTCHSVGWRSDCVFCHGGNDGNLTGAPPRDLGALPMSASQSFLAHTVHDTEGISRAYACLRCHVELDVGHAFDATPAAAEVTFASGLSAAGNYDGAGACSSLYCHGNGQGDNGSAVDGGAAMQCHSCHPGMASTEAQWQSMSGKHRKHLAAGLDCGDCHLDVTGDGTTILDPLLHVDGLNQLRFSDPALVYDAGRCSGDCHGERHQGQVW
jgi:predicted CxxxxCH...CXXCH cytochrome family protein